MSKISQLIENAYETIPYYRQVFNTLGIEPTSIVNSDDLRNIPILTKDLIRKNIKQIVADNGKSPMVFRTSGSTGDFLTVYWLEEELRASLHHLWQIRYKIYNIRPGDPYVTFHVSTDKNIVLVNKDSMLNELSFDSSNIIANAPLYYEKMIEFKPKYIRAAPSLLYILSDYILKHALQPPKSIQYIETSGEYLPYLYRNTIEMAFHLSVVNQYGCREANTIAIECPEGHLHVLTDNVVVEIVDEDANGQGTIHITCLTNHYMPFIRYNIGDIGSLCKNHSCKCGNKAPILNISNGRVNDFVVMSDGSRIFSGVFVYAVDLVNEHYNNIIRQFKVIQKSEKDFEVRFIMDQQHFCLRRNIEKMFTDELMKFKFIDTNFQFSYHDCLFFDSVTGKYKYFEKKFIPKNDG